MAWIWDEFVGAYLNEYMETKLTVLDVGGPSELRRVFTNSGRWEYKSVNIRDGADFVIRDNPFDWVQVETNSIDVVVSTDTFEHITYVWMTFFEIARVLKNRGLAFIQVPSATPEHPGLTPPGYRDNKYFDCWRIYCDGLSALCKYVGFREIEVFTEWGLGRIQNTYLVMQKPDLSLEELQSLVVRGWHQKRALTTKIGPTTEIWPTVIFSPATYTSVIRAQECLDVAFKLYEKAGSNGDREPYYYSKLGKLQLWKGRTTAAINSFKIAIGLLESDPTRFLYKYYMDMAFDANLHSLYASLGEAQFKAGLIEAAITSVKHCVSLRPNFFEGPYLLITIYLSVNDFESALYYCSELEKINAEHGIRRASEVKMARTKLSG